MKIFPSVGWSRWDYFRNKSIILSEKQTVLAVALSVLKGNIPKVDPMYLIASLQKDCENIRCFEPIRNGSVSLLWMILETKMFYFQN